MAGVDGLEPSMPESKSGALDRLATPLSNTAVLYQNIKIVQV